MNETKIEWTDKTWNPVTGCTKVSQGCKNCYAERMFHRPYPGRNFGDVRCHPERLDQPLRWRKPCRIFVNSMSDLFHEAVPVRFIVEVFDKMVSHPLICRKKVHHEHDEDCQRSWRHTYQILTKRPARMLKILKLGGLLEQDVGECWPGDSAIALEYEVGPSFSNVWLGVSVEDQKSADERIPLLLQTPAAVRWVSYEPALGPVDFREWIPASAGMTGLDWIAAGGESGPMARPAHPEWFRSVRDQCQAAGAPFFFKQWGEWSGDPSLFAQHHRPTPLRVYAEEWGVIKVGKKRAGRLLDGREWNEYPQ